MNDAGLRRLVPGGKRFLEKSLGRLGIFGRHGRFHAARERADFAADLQVMLGMRRPTAGEL